MPGDDIDRQRTYSFGAGIQPYVSLGLVPAFLVVLGCVIIARRGWNEDSRNYLFVALSFLLIVFAWIRGFRVVLNGDELRYRTLFGRWRSIRRGDIGVGEFESTFRTDRKPMYGLFIHPKKGVKIKPIVINLKVFRMSDIRYLRAWLAEKADGKMKKSLLPTSTNDTNN